uniref:Uncharacterized protein n=1 Tax=Anguilla anguilla TaxID=7936 RepID=A0A0E9WYM8_ANGAN
MCFIHIDIFTQRSLAYDLDLLQNKIKKYASHQCTIQTLLSQCHKAALIFIYKECIIFFFHICNLLVCICEYINIVQ